MQIEIPTLEGARTIEVEPGRPVILLGPNGSGKSRLGIYIDDLDSSGASHRIPAQRSLEMPDEIFSEGYDQAIAALRRDKTDKRRKRPSPGSMEFAYEQLLATLFAEHHRALESAHVASTGRPNSRRPTTLIGRLQALWSELIPHQRLIFADRSVRAVTENRATPFDGSEMSDGERLVVYVLGQALLLSENGLLIVDEPELHMSRALLARLWDAVERARPDCSFIYITHDVDFAASRRGARLYAVLDYRPPTTKSVVIRGRKQTVEDAPPRWTLESLPSSADVPGEMLVRIVGSRQPILFVEGRTGGLDHLVYKAVYRNFTVIPVESCSQVVQFVRSFATLGSLHRLHCAGLVDMDHRDAAPGGRLETGLYSLPVSEIENLFLVGDVFVALAAALAFSQDEAIRRLARLKAEVLALARRETDRMSLKRTSARIWESSGSMGIKAKTIAELTRLYAEMVARTNPEAIYEEHRAKYDHLLEAGDYDAILRLYDNKGGLLNLLAKCLDLGGRTELAAFVARILVQDRGKALVDALVKTLPTIDAEA